MTNYANPVIFVAVGLHSRVGFVECVGLASFLILHFSVHRVRLDVANFAGFAILCAEFS